MQLMAAPLKVKMNKTILIFLAIVVALSSCNGGGKSAVDTEAKKTGDATKNIQQRKRIASPFHTQYVYTDSLGGTLTVQNSFPKSGIQYTDPNGEKFVYAVFWTNIKNETNAPFKLSLEFPSDSFEIPPSSGNYMRLLLPTDTVTIDDAALYDYGLDIKPFLDKGIHHSSTLTRTIAANSESGFYVVPLSNRGVGGTLRTGLSIKGQALFYTVNDKVIYCGKVSSNHLTLSKK